MDRPSYEGSYVTTPEVSSTIQLLGFAHRGSVALTHDQLRHIQKLYGFVKEQPQQKPDPPAAPRREDFKMLWEFENAERDHERALKRHEKWEDPQALFQAGADRNALRHAQFDGMRIIAWLAQYVPVGEDPLKHVVQLASQAGFDVSIEDVEWAADI